MNKTRIKVFIISQQVLFRRGVELALSSVEGIEVAGTADYSNGIEYDIDDSPPDVALLDIDTPSDNGLELSRNIKRRLPNIGIIVLTSNTSDAQLFQALKSQVAAYLDKEVTPEKLVDTIKMVAHGEHPINESLTTRSDVAELVLQQFQELSRRIETDDLIYQLTKREVEILNHMAQGSGNRQIATTLGISEQTIKSHVTSILRKLNVNARTEAVVVAIKQGIISLG